MRRRPRQLSLKECYAILKLEKKADLQAVKRAYRRRAFELHPDLNPNNPEASQQFQLLNEAYVALSAVLKPAEEAAHKKEAQKNRENKAEAGQAEEPSGSTSHQTAGQSDQHTGQSAGQTAGQNTGPNAGQDNTQTGGQGEDTGEHRGAEQAGTTHAYAEQDVLRDLLNDPFARRVFEDIYSELSRQQGENSQGTATGPAAAGPQSGTGTGQSGPTHANAGPHTRGTRPNQAGQQGQQSPRKETAAQSWHDKHAKLHQGNLAWGTPKWDADMGKGVKGVVKDWLRRQIDEEQSICLPAAGLVPGRRVRLQIRKALAAEPTTIEITLPPDFVIGKPIRLRGLGKRVGPWQGDLYLTIRSQ